MDIVELGLVGDVEVEGAKVHVTYTLTSMACPVGPMIAEDIDRVIRQVPGVEDGEGWFGQSVALSADGSTAVVGIPQENANTGTARIFTRSGSGWKQQAELNGGGAEDALGLSVALSADGNTALLGAPKRNEVLGGAYVFVRDDDKWKQQGAILSGH